MSSLVPARDTAGALHAALTAIEHDPASVDGWSNLWALLERTRETSEPHRLCAALTLALSFDRTDRIPAEKETLHQVLKKLTGLRTGVAVADWLSRWCAGDLADDALRRLFLAFLEFSANRSHEMEV